MKARSLLIVSCTVLFAVAVGILQVMAQEPGPRLRIAHLAPKVAAVDVYAGDMKLVEDLTFRSVSDYLLVKPGMLMVSVTPTGSGPESSLTPKPISVAVPNMADGYFTAAVVGDPQEGTLEIVLLQDGTPAMMPAAPGEAAVGNLAISAAWARPTRAAEPPSMSEMATPAMGGGMGEMATPAGAGMSGMHMATGDVSAAYMLIKNTGSTPERLVAVESDVTDDAQIHQTVIENDVARMQELEMGLEIPAGGQVELMPGGYHIMLVNVKRPLVPGDVIHLTLKFESGTAVALTLPVRAMMMP